MVSYCLQNQELTRLLCCRSHFDQSLPYRFIYNKILILLTRSYLQYIWIIIYH